MWAGAYPQDPQATRTKDEHRVQITAAAQDSLASQAVSASTVHRVPSRSYASSAASFESGASSSTFEPGSRPLAPEIGA
jgi:hypothetical protein